ncbi:MAG: hypothetical protein AAGN66_15235 [Acidobacteriota bacterium]
MSCESTAVLEPPKRESQSHGDGAAVDAEKAENGTETEAPDPQAAQRNTIELDSDDFPRR